MGHRLSKIYTRTGDKGTTGLGDGSRVAKNDTRMEAIGTVDELNSQLGVVLSLTDLPSTIAPTLTRIQHQLFDLGGELCLPGQSFIESARVTWLESELDAFNASLPPLKEFILPGGSQANASLHMARAICRRAERILVSLNDQAPVNPVSLQYLNRLSDLLFVLARIAVLEQGGREVYWEKHD